MAEKNKPILKVQNLKVFFETSRGLIHRERHVIRAVDNVSFQMKKGTTVGLVGESGSGKSTIGKAITRIVPRTAGKVYLRQERIDHLPEDKFFPYRKKIQMIFQDPYNSLNPRMTVGGIIGEPIGVHFPELSKEAREDRVIDLLEKVGLSGDFANRYPHQFSGGQRQRISIARALGVEPELIICDESVSALDVSVQAQIVNLLMDLQDEFGLTYLFISHDLAIVNHMSDYVLVMEKGQIKEQGTAEAIYQNPTDPYTIKLLEAVPKMPTLVSAASNR